jgi:nitrite reductase (NADH) large subunit
MSPLAAKAWICPRCGYIHYGPEPPDECPICGTEKDFFEPYTEAAAAPAVSAPQPSAKAIKVVVAGAGIAGVTAAEAVHKADPGAETWLISNEPGLPYYRLNLTRYLAGEVGEAQLDLHPESWYAGNNIHLMRNTALAAIDPGSKEVTLMDGSRLSYDRLILTTGSRPFVPPFSGTGRKYVTTLRTRQDADFILEACRERRNCACIGGGLLGLETAGALARQGGRVTVLENQAWLLPRQLNQAAGRLLHERIKTAGIRVHYQARTRELAGNGAVSGVIFEDGSQLPAELVIISAGIRSNTDLARGAGLAVNQGILVDNHLKTSHADIYAAGDAAEYLGVVYGIWTPSQLQGEIAGLNAAGIPAEFTGVPRSNTLKVLGYDLFSIGQISPLAAIDQAIDAQIDGNYACFVFHDCLMAGAILLGDGRLAAKVKKVIESRQDCSYVLSKKPGAKEIIQFLEGVT